MDKQWSVLEDAVSDIGYWSWWAERLPDAYQVEFGGAQLWFPPEEGLPPAGRLAIRFDGPRAICLLRDPSSALPENWAELLHKDQLEPFTLDYGEFRLNSREHVLQLLDAGFRQEFIVGDRSAALREEEGEVSLSFSAGEAGLVIVAKEFQLLNRFGAIGADDIQRAVSKWWEYWRDYWARRGTDEALPLDYACEVTIPLKAPE